MPEKKTVGDGIARIAETLDKGGAGIHSIAVDLSSEIKKIVAAVGKKASAAIAPATEAVQKLLNQYIEEKKLVVKRLYEESMFLFIFGAVLTLITIGLLAPSIVNIYAPGQCDGWAFACTMIGIATGIFSLGSFIGGFDARSKALFTQETITSSSIDKLVKQFHSIRE